MDNAPSHPPAADLKSSDGMIFVMFMPPNVTPLIQPMDQNVLRLTKLFYRNSLLSSIITGNDTVGEALKKTTLRDAVIHLMAAWEKLNPDMISKCWRNILDFTDALDEDDLPLSRIRQQLIEERAADPIRDTIALLGAIGPVSFAFVHFCLKTGFI